MISLLLMFRILLEKNNSLFLTPPIFLFATLINLFCHDRKGSPLRNRETVDCFKMSQTVLFKQSEKTDLKIVKLVLIYGNQNTDK